ncbi:DUF1697 domain-containing protein [Roseibium sediminicola]|uniref:DUF1697 domain-containing protein n=1 Tax=Roseibium sediminicola TaxID=2933272 RepID=A0ABT0GY02_9HYPH|nr:DUF1697 domain-containing protein [Roseibium sp. CAU 1639]MCK7614317.1 DUF1697 domain-containing protein [Roseibium sp. CAU 1639]
MAVFVALLRAVNVGGTGKLPMADLRAMAEALGFDNIATYIQSGNLVFTSDLAAEEVLAGLDDALTAHFGKSPGIMLRALDELEALYARMPFQDAQPSQVLVTFLQEETAPDALEHMVAADGEEAVVLGSEIVVHYPNGQGRSKLKLPALKPGTARNLNTVRKLLELARERG